MFGRCYTIFYNGNTYDVYRRGVWIWQGLMDASYDGMSEAVKYPSPNML